jgi:hypothetical protein
MLLPGLIAAAPAMAEEPEAAAAQAQLVATPPTMLWIGRYRILETVVATAPCRTVLTGRGIRFDPDVGGFIRDPKAEREDLVIDWSTVASIFPVPPKPGSRNVFFKLDAPGGPNPNIYLYYGKLADRDRMAEVARVLIRACATVEAE